MDDDSMNFRKLFYIVSGLFLVALGIAGLFLPFLQGVLLIIAGLLLLAPHSKTVRRYIALFRKKYPRLYARAQSVRKMFRRKER
jgi:uncharacterized membrane protein YbaN (DUF454 family)